MTEAPGKREGLITREDCVLLVIDAQERLMPVIHRREEVTKNIVRLIKFAHIIGLPIIYTEQENLGPTIPEVHAVASDLEPMAKIHFNCFYNRAFGEKIATLSPRTLLLAGVETHICVAQTALYALPHFTVHVISDATSSRVTENWAFSIERMRQCGAVITTTEMLMYELLQKAGTDEFRAALLLVK